MSQPNKHITVFEHQSIKLDEVFGEVKFDDAKLRAFQNYHGEHGVPYFSLTNKGVRFCEYVGVLQVGNTIIEVLPKADDTFTGNDEKRHWRDILIDMLLIVGAFDIHAPSSSALKLKPNSILDLYIQLFIQEVEYLLHNGLIKQYRKKEGNITALKGSLQFAKHLQQNLIHQERFYVRHTVYDIEHKLHFILYKTICLLKHINTNAALHSRIGVLLLHFPEMPDIKVTESTFDQLLFTRKNQAYKTAIDIAKLLLLRFHPNVNRGNNEVLALMFDMNKLWEQFVYVSLRKYKEAGASISSQLSVPFWRLQGGSTTNMKADIVLNKEQNNCIVLDTKWKNLNGYKPSSNDLRQMYVYHEYYGANKVVLVYPGKPEKSSTGSFYELPAHNGIAKECSILYLEMPYESASGTSLVRSWQQQIHTQCLHWWNKTL